MNTKAALELSTTMLVVIIISIVIFAAGITLLWKVYGGAKDVQASIEQSTQQQIEAMLVSGKSLVAIPINELPAKAGKQVVFGVGIRNIGINPSFSLVVSFEGAYRLDGTKITENIDPDLGTKWLGGFASTKNIVIKPNEYQTIPILVKPRASTKGNYVFNVCVFNQATVTEPCSTDGTYAGFDLYDKIYQITVKLS